MNNISSGTGGPARLARGGRGAAGVAPVQLNRGPVMSGPEGRS
jgi:hypothetical protein